MVENGLRLRYQIEMDSFVIIDILTGKTLSYNNGTFQLCNLPIKDVIAEINTLVECFTTAADDVRFFSKRNKDTSDVLKIEHLKHLEWSMSMKGYNAHLTTGHLTKAKGFEDTMAITRLQFVVSILTQSQSSIRRPGVDVVRRISDAKLLLWVHAGHTVVHSEAAVQGLMMVNCLVDGIAYDCLQVSPSRESKTCSLIDLEGRVVQEFPLDDSILTYYHTAEELFEEEE